MSYSIHPPGEANSNKFLLRIPIVLKDFRNRFSGQKSVCLTSEPVKCSAVVGYDGADSSWTLEARHTARDAKTSFYVAFWTKSDIDLEVERCIGTSDASGHCPTTSRVVTEKQGQHFIKNKYTFAGSLRFPDDMVSDDDDLIVCAFVRFEIRARLIGVPSDGGSELTSALKAKLDDPIYHDFTLVGSDGQQVKCHKLVLGSVSPVFHAMFSTDCKETRTGICIIEDADSEGIQAMLDCIFGEDVDGLNPQYLEKVFLLADKYGLVDLKQRCARALGYWIEYADLGDSTHLDIIMSILLLADQHNIPQLKNEVFIFLENNLNEAIIYNAFSRVIEVGKTANGCLYDEFQEHLHLRRRGAPRERSS